MKIFGANILISQQIIQNFYSQTQDFSDYRNFPPPHQMCRARFHTSSQLDFSTNEHYKAPYCLNQPISFVSREEVGEEVKLLNLED